MALRTVLVGIYTDRAVRCWAVAAILLLAACGGAQSTPELRVRSTRIVIESPAPFTKRADFPMRLESTLDVALRYWGGNWSDLEGKTVVLSGEQHVQCVGSSNAIGCYEGGEIRVSTQDAGSTFSCVEETVLVHEIGHAVVGDPDHTDPRWMDFASVMQELDGRPGYDESGEVPCRIFVALWKHPAPAPGA